MNAPLLVELLTEELPPRSLAALSSAFCDALLADLRREGFVGEASAARAFATPRRLAVLITEVAEQAPDSQALVKGPSLKAGLDAQGRPTPALLGFAKKRGVPVEVLERFDDGKQVLFAHRSLAKGGRLEAILEQKVEAALKALPVAKIMRWGSGEAQFVRPVHRVVMLHGERVVPARVLGIESGRVTLGHRFMSKASIELRGADEYQARLASEGMVIADFAERRAEIERQLREEATRQGASLGEFGELLDEVTALVEHPSVYVGSFDEAFLEIPQECLILTMRQNQKYFPLIRPDGRLLPRFLIVSNMQVADPRPIVEGNERVVRPRLEDARFFYNQDRKERLEARMPRLEQVVYHNKLGTQLQRAMRLQQLAGTIAAMLGSARAPAERAGWLAKADLLTGMVGEFPELQGVMGCYYALHDGEAPEVADAIAAHYWPRFAGDALPQGNICAAVALADKLDTLAGLFGIFQQPTGDKDPFALRRAAAGVIRIVVEKDLPLSLHELTSAAFEGFSGKVANAHTDLEMFVFERLRSYLYDRGYSANETEAVLCLLPDRFNEVPRQLEAVRAFSVLPEAGSLAAANKRVANILKQAEAKGESFVQAEARLFTDAAEMDLFDALQQASQSAAPLFQHGDYTGYLKAFAVLKSPVDAFFDSVMVMVEDASIRQNRLALLADLRREMNRFADLSKLAA